MRSFVFSRLFICFAVIFCSVISFIIFLPTIVNTSWGNRQLAAFINRSIPGHLEFQKLSLRWGKGQNVEGVSLYDPEGHLVLNFDKFYTEATLWQIIQKSTHIGHTQIEDLNVSISTDEKGISNLQRALGVATVHSYHSILSSTIFLTNVNADLYLFARQEPLSVHLTGLTRQGSLNGSFNIDAALQKLDSKSWDELGYQAETLLSIEGSKEAKIEAKIINFPVDLLDRFISLKKPELAGIFRATLGDRLNIIAHKEPSQEELAFTLDVLTPLMESKLKGKIDQGQFSLQEPATLTLNLAPDLINPFIKSHIQLIDSSSLKMTIEELMFPLAFINSEKSINPCLLGFKIQVQTQQPARVDVFPLDTIKVLNGHAILESALCAQTVSLKVRGEAQQAEEQEAFAIHFDSTFAKPSSLKEVVTQIKKDSESSLTLTRFPLFFFKPYAGNQAESMARLLGQRANIEVKLKQLEMDVFSVVASIKTPQLSFSQLQFRATSQELTLTTPFTLEYLITPDTVTHFLGSLPTVLKEPCLTKVSIQQLIIPLLDKQKGKLQACLMAPQIGLSDWESFSSIGLKNFRLEVEGNLFSPLKTKLSTQVGFVHADSLYGHLLGEQAYLTLNSDVKLTPNGSIELPYFKTDLEAKQVAVHLEGRITPLQQLILTAPIQVSGYLTPMTWQTIEWLNLNQIKLQEIAHINLNIHPFEFPLKKDVKNSLSTIKGVLSSNHLSIQDSLGNITAFESVNIPWEFDFSKNSVEASLAGNISTAFSFYPTPLSGRVILQHWLNQQGDYDLSHLKMELVSNLIGIPVSLMNPFLSSTNLTPFLGSTLDIELKAFIDRSQQIPGYWDMNLDSSHFHAKARLKIDEAITLYESNTAAEFRWTLTPEGYQLLKQINGVSLSNEVELLEPLVLKGTLTQLHVPLKNKNFLLENGKLWAKFTTNEMQWKQPAYPFPLPIFKIEGDIHSNNLSDQLFFAANMFSKNNSPFLSSKGTLYHLADLVQQRNIDLTDIHMDLELHELPLTLASILPFWDKSYQSHLQALLGDDLSGQVSMQLYQKNGTLAGHIQGNRGHFSLDGQIKEGILTLNQDLQGKVLFTPELSQAFLIENAPIFSSAFASEEPITIIIHPEGFSVPLIPFKLNQLTIKRGSVELGKVHFVNKDELKMILHLLKPISANQFTIWFTPLYFEIANGKLMARRIDMLVANTYRLASWGEIDLETHKLDMTLGLSGQALKYAFDLPDLDSTYMLQIPIKGKKGNSQIDKKKVAARISALIARTRGNTEGKILGTILEIASSENQDIRPPEPTTQPFPWGNLEIADPKPLEDSLEKEEQDKPKKPAKNNELNQAWQELEKNASYLLDFLNH